MGRKEYPLKFSIYIPDFRARKRYPRKEIYKEANFKKQGLERYLNRLTKKHEGDYGFKSELSLGSHNQTILYIDYDST